LAPAFSYNIIITTINMKEYALREVAQHKKKGDLWMVVHGKGRHEDLPPISPGQPGQGADGL
jgi:hypothetical protein